VRDSQERSYCSAKEGKEIKVHSKVKINENNIEFL